MTRLNLGMLMLVVAALTSACGAYADLELADAKVASDGDERVRIAATVTCDHNTPNVTCADRFEHVCVSARFLDASVDPPALLDELESCSSDVPPGNGDFRSVDLVSTVPIVTAGPTKIPSRSQQRLDGTSPLVIELGLRPDRVDLRITDF